METGTILMYGGSSAPTGYLLCDGASVNRVTYAALFAVVGTTYGSLSGSTFTLPDLRVKMPIGANGSSPTVLGSAGGNFSHSHNILGQFLVTGADSLTPVPVDVAVPTQAVADAGHTHDLTIPDTSSDNANPPYLAINFIIKT